MLHLFMHLFLTYKRVMSMNIALIQQGLNRWLPIKTFEIHINYIYNDIFNAKP